LEATGDLEFIPNTWEVFDMNGKELNENILLINESPERITLDVSSISNGTYVISVKGSKNQVFLGRIIKVK
jgi:hypothetical protein